MRPVRTISRKDLSEASESLRILRGHTPDTHVSWVMRWSDLHGDMES